MRYGRINVGASVTTGEDFFLGKGERVQGVGGRADRKLIETRINPTLLSTIQHGGSNKFMRGALLALAKSGDERNRAKIDFVLQWYLNQENATNEQMSEVAPIALGILGDPASYSVLSSLALDNEAGRKTFGEEVGQDMRAFSAYGLGLIGSKAKPELRRQVVRDLVSILEEENAGSNQLQVAAMFALGLVPLEVVEDEVVCYCGTCKVEGPESSLQAQVTYLLRYFTADKEFDPIVRAHTATTMARLIAARPDGMTLRLKEVVTEFLVESLEKYAKQPPVVKQSVALALGLIGDADDEGVDRAIRYVLNRSATRGGPMEKRFALMSLAQVGARRGNDVENPWAATNEVRERLVHQMSRAKKDVRPWAGLALGVMGYHLSANGQELDRGVDIALRNASRSAKTADTLGAYALASGLRADEEAADPLVAKLDKLKDEAAASYAALALGLMGSKTAIEPIEELLAEAEEKPLLAMRAGVALGMLGGEGIVVELIEVLKTAESQDAKCAAARTLGYLGDRRGIEALLEITRDQDESIELRESAVSAIGFASDTAGFSWRTALTGGTNYLAQSPTLTGGDDPGVLDMR